MVEFDIEEHLKEKNPSASLLDRITLFGVGVTAVIVYPLVYLTMGLAYLGDLQGKEVELRRYKMRTKGDLEGALKGDWRYPWQANKKARNLRSSID